MKKNFFQKLMDGLFEEVVIEETIENTEDEVELPPVSNVIKQKSTEIEKKVESIKSESIKEEPKKESRSGMISIDDLKEPVVKKAANDRKVNQEYEFTQVISPIFGIVGEKQEKDEDFVPASVTKKKKNIKNASVLGTVISPIYGITRDDNSVETDYEIEVEDTLTLDDLIEKREQHPLADEAIDPIHHEANFDSLVKALEEIQETEKIQKKSTIQEGQNLSLFDDFDDFQF